MPLTALRYPPGVVRDPTRYAAEGNWINSDKIRFRGNEPETIGGWQKAVDIRYLGVGRRLADWGTVDGSLYIAVGTTYKLYVITGDQSFDVTPVRAIEALAANPIDTINGSPVVTITDVNHGAVAGDFVTLSGVPGSVGGVSDTIFNAEHRIEFIVDADSYTIQVEFSATSTANGGGSAVVAEYQANVGLDTYVSSTGWGSGAWGSGTFGGGTNISPSGQLRLWDLAPFGDDLISCIRGGGIFYWDESVGTSTRSTLLADIPRRTRTLTPDPLTAANTSTTITVFDELGHDVGVGDTVTLSGIVAFAGLSGGELNAEQTVTAVLDDTRYQFEVTTAATSSASGGGSVVVSAYTAGQYYAPDKALGVAITDQSRHVVAFGAPAIGENEINPLLIRWSDAAAPAVWRPATENLAGDQLISLGSVYVGNVSTRQERLVFTDAGIISMRYIGAPFVFSFNEVATGVSLISPNAAVAVNDVVYFMARGGFYRYSGALEELPCPHEDTIFGEIDRTQPYKVFAASNTDYNEISWFYQSTDSAYDIDKYITYNYQLNVWYGGTMVRGTWSDADTRRYPMATTVLTDTSSTDPIATTSGSSSITVTQTAHGLSVGDELIFSDFAGVGGISDEIINSMHVVATVPTVDTYTIDTYYDATSTASGGGAGTIKRSNLLYSHDVGYAGDEVAIDAFIEGSDVDLDDGETFQFIHRVVPDFKWRGTYQDTSTVTVKIKRSRYPAATQTTQIDFDATPILTHQNVRLRDRQTALRLESSASSYGWRLGVIRVDLREDGRN